MCCAININIKRIAIPQGADARRVYAFLKQLWMHNERFITEEFPVHYMGGQELMRGVMTFDYLVPRGDWTIDV